MLELPQGQLHGLCLMARLILDAVLHAKGTLLKLPVTALWVMPQVLL